MTQGGTADRPSAPLLADDRFRAALDAMLDDVAIGEAIRDDDGQIVDFVMVYLNPATLDGAGRRAEDLVGRRVCESFPGWAESGLLDRFASVVDTGTPFVQDRVAYEGTAPDGTVIQGHWSMSIVRFGDGYIASTRDVTELVAEEEAKREAARRLEHHRLAVELLQRAALPTSLPELPGWAFGAQYRAAEREQPVGGDWYDGFVLDDGRVGVVIADVAGHGPDAAAFMLQVRNVVRALAFEHDEPDVVLSRANEVVARFDEQHLFATCCYGVIDAGQGSFRWANAGHLPPVLRRDGAETLALASGPPLGVEPSGRYPVEQVVLAPGEVVVLATDGLVEQRDVPIEDCLAAFADRVAATGDAGADRVAADLVAGTERSCDDLAVLCIQRTA